MIHHIPRHDFKMSLTTSLQLHLSIHLCILSPVIAAVVAINKAIDAGDPHVTFTSLQHPDAHILDLDEAIEEKYQTHLATQKSNKADVNNLIFC